MGRLGDGMLGRPGHARTRNGRRKYCLGQPRDFAGLQGGRIRRESGRLRGSPLALLSLSLDLTFLLPFPWSFPGRKDCAGFVLTEDCVGERPSSRAREEEEAGV